MNNKLVEEIEEILHKHLGLLANRTLRNLCAKAIAEYIEEKEKK